MTTFKFKHFSRSVGTMYDEWAFSPTDAIAEIGSPRALIMSLHVVNGASKDRSYLKLRREQYFLIIHNSSWDHNNEYKNIQWNIIDISEQDFVGLTHWGQVTHKCFGKLTSIGSDNGLLPG